MCSGADDLFVVRRAFHHIGLGGSTAAISNAETVSCVGSGLVRGFTGCIEAFVCSRADGVFVVRRACHKTVAAGQRGTFVAVIFLNFQLFNLNNIKEGLLE